MSRPARSDVDDWEKHVVVVRGRGQKFLCLKLTEKPLGTTEQVSALCSAIAHVCATTKGGGGPMHANVDAMDTGIRDEGLKQMLETLTTRGIQCKVLRLHRNCLTDVGAVILAEQILRQTQAVEELHLSYNEISEKGALALGLAIQSHDAYPLTRVRGSQPVPIWFRLERNFVGNARGVSDVLQAQGLWVCDAQKRDACTQTACIAAGANGVPKAHMLSFLVQRTRRGQPERSTAELQALVAELSDRLAIPKARSGQRAAGTKANPAPSTASTCSAGSVESSIVTEGAEAARDAGRAPSGAGAVRPATQVLDNGPALPVILPSQVEGDSCTWLCGICETVARRPVYTRGDAILFCGQCFSSHVAAEKAKQGGRVLPTVPCPKTGRPLARGDVLPLEQEKALRRLYEQLSVNCAACQWSGALAAYDEHLTSCPGKTPVEETARTEALSPGTPQVSSVPAPAADLVTVLHSYSGGDPPQLSLTAGTEVEVLSTSETGWSYVRVEGQDPGWFPTNHLAMPSA
mmetsp:Transcript_39073/g.93760  ORF Transcript_39073/g.93760 Transcript_39073/m.93760 type:complete len:519 (+) Transcript_39073:157-1713(+)